MGHATAGLESPSPIMDKYHDLYLFKQFQGRKMTHPPKFLAPPSPATNRMDAKVSILQAFKKYYIAPKYKDAPIGIVQARHNFVHLYNTGAINCGAETFIKTISAVTLARWQKLVSDHGVSALAGNYGKTRGQTIIDQNPAIKGYILAILQQTPPCVGKTHHTGP